MENMVLDGTFAEVKQRLSALPLNSEAHLCVVVTETESSPQPEEAFFASAPRRNGLILVPTKVVDVPVTIDLVKSLSDD